MRLSRNQYNPDGRLINGYDYTNQAWVLDGVYKECGLPQTMDCSCYGCINQGEQPAPENKDRIQEMVADGFAILG